MTSSTMPTDSTDRFGYDPITETYHAQHDWTSDVPLSITVVEVVAAVISEEPTEMEPLHAAIDPDALDTLLSSGTDPGIQVEFQYEEHSVTVNGNGEIVLG